MDVGDLYSVAVTMIVTGVVIAIGLSVLGDQRDDLGVDACAARSDPMTNFNTTSKLCYNTTATAAPGEEYYNATVDAINGSGELASKLPLVGLVVGAAIVIGVLLKVFRE